MSHRKLLYILTSAPYSNSDGQEALDAILIGAAFEHTVSILFMHEGVFQLKSGQNTEGTEIKQFTKTYAALGDFGVQNVFVHDLSMQTRGLTPIQLNLHAQELSSDQIRCLISEQCRVFTF